MVCFISVEAFGNYRAEDSMENSGLQGKTFQEVISRVLADYRRRSPGKEAGNTVQVIRSELSNGLYIPIGNRRFIHIKPNERVDKYFNVRSGLELTFIVPALG